MATGTDGSLKILRKNVVSWSVQPANPNSRYLVLQNDGSLVLYDVCSDGQCHVWDTGTSNKGIYPYRLFINNDSNLYLVDGSGNILWSSSKSDTAPVGGGCTLCSAGTYSSAFGILCEECGAGTFSGKTGSRLNNLMLLLTLLDYNCWSVPKCGHNCLFAGDRVEYIEYSAD